MSIESISLPLQVVDGPKSNFGQGPFIHRMEEAFALGVEFGELVRDLTNFRKFAQMTEILPAHLIEQAGGDAAFEKALQAAYLYGLMFATLKYPKLSSAVRQDAVNISSRFGHYLTQALLMSSRDGRLKLYGVFGDLVVDQEWQGLWVGSLGVAKAAVGLAQLGLKTRYPQPVVDTLHGIDLFAGEIDNRWLAIQIKASRFESRALVPETKPEQKPRGLTQKEWRSLLRVWHGVQPLNKHSRREVYNPAFLRVDVYSEPACTLPSRHLQSVLRSLRSTLTSREAISA